MNNKSKFFIITAPIIMALCSLFLICDYVDAAPRTAVRSAPAARKPVTTKTTSTTTQANTQQNTETVVDTEPDVVEEPELIIENKSSQFDDVVASVMETATSDNSFAEMIRKQRAALEASEASMNTRDALKSGKNSCDAVLRECMMKTCGNDFTKCALDGDTVFGDKLNKCRRDTECSGEEFRLLTTEIKADRDMNVKLASYDSVINCGNQYNACIVNECGTTYSKCLGRAAETAAIQKCSVIARECAKSDSGLASRFGTVIGKLREGAEKDIKKDEQRLYELRDLMAKSCTSMGAMFDERTFDCVYTVNFYAGENQTTPTASRKRYAGDTFICMQEWFGINATTYKENAYRETRAQTAASSAMLGSGLGTAAGLVTSGAMGRALETQKAKKALKEEERKQECEKNGGTWTDGKCDEGTDTNKKGKQDKKSKNQQECEEGKEWKDDKCVDKNTSELPASSSIEIEPATPAEEQEVPEEDDITPNEEMCLNAFKRIKTYTNGDKATAANITEDNQCKIKECESGYTPSDDGMSCVAQEPTNVNQQNDNATQSITSTQNTEVRTSDTSGELTLEQFDKIKGCITEIYNMSKTINPDINTLFSGAGCFIAIKTNSGFYYVLDDAELIDLGTSDTWGGYYDTCTENDHIYNPIDGIQEYEEDACELLDQVKQFANTHTSCPSSQDRDIYTDANKIRFCAQTDIINSNFTVNTASNVTPTTTPQSDEKTKQTKTRKDYKKIKECIEVINGLIGTIESQDKENLIPNAPYDKILYTTLRNGDVVLSADEARNISPLWNYANMQYYDKKHPKDEKNQDACDALNKLKVFRTATATQLPNGYVSKTKQDGRSISAPREWFAQNNNVAQRSSTDANKKDLKDNKPHKIKGMSNPKDIKLSPNPTSVIVFRPSNNDNECTEVIALQTHSCSISGVRLHKNEYALEFDYGYVYGIAICEEQDCYCTATAFLDKRKTEMYEPNVSAVLHSKIGNCNDVCAQECAIKLGNNVEFRTKVFEDLMKSE